MSDDEWNRALTDLRDLDDIERAVRAIETLDRLADRTRIPELYALLDDPEFFVREAAATPVARIEGLAALPALFRAITRGETDGHDNDGLQATIWDLLEADAAASSAVLLGLLDHADPELRCQAAWGLGFVASAISPDRLLAPLRDDASPAVRAAAAVSLGSFPGNAVARAALTEATRDPADSVREAAWRGLADLDAG